MIPFPSLSPSSLKSAVVYHLIIPLVILFPALVLQPQPYFPAPKFLIHSSSPPAPSSLTIPDYVVILPQAFHMDVFCNGQRASTCQLTRVALYRAGERLASVMQLRAPIVARVDLTTPAPTAGGRGRSGGALGLGAPALSLPVRHVDDDCVYMYPRALVKQMPEMDGAEQALAMLGSTPGLGARWDVFVEVNAGEEWWVEGGRDGAEIQSHQYDLEYLLLHELVHSLGFGHDLILHHLAPLPSRLSPAYDSHPIPTQNDPSTFIRFAHPSIWNRFTLLHHTPLVAYKQVLDDAMADLVRQGHLRPLPAHMDSRPAAYRPADVYLALAGHAKGSQAMRDMYDWGVTNGSLVFDTGAWPIGRKGGVKVELETGLVPFDPASSAGHVHIPSASTATTSAEFLMGWQLKRGVRLSRLASDAGQRGDRGGAIGPITRAVLGALGYTMVGQEAGWVTRKGIARVDLDEVRRMMEAAAEKSGGGQDKALGNGMAWVGVAGVVAMWGMHRGWWV